MRGLSCAAAAIVSPAVQQAAATQPSGDATISVPGWLQVFLRPWKHSTAWFPLTLETGFHQTADVGVGERHARVHGSVFKGLELQTCTFGAGLPAREVALPTSRGCITAAAKRFHAQHGSNYTAAHLKDCRIPMVSGPCMTSSYN